MIRNANKFTQSHRFVGTSSESNFV
jgi:hypothetical protein